MILDNPKHERYAKQRANGLIPSKAAIASGFAPGSSIATALEKDADVQARVSELLTQKMEERERVKAASTRSLDVAAEITGVTHAWVLTQLSGIATEARADADYKEATNAIKLIGEHLGMWKKANPDEQEINHAASVSISDEMLEQLSAINKHTEYLDEVPIEVQALPSSEELVSLIGAQSGKSQVNMITNSEADVAMHPDSTPDPSDYGKLLDEFD